MSPVFAALAGVGIGAAAAYLIYKAYEKEKQKAIASKFNLTYQDKIGGRFALN
jgi:hypothetical protein